MLNTRRPCLLAALLLCASLAAAGQEAKPLTNDVVVAMLKAGLPETTVILAIQKGPANFDTSPQALIQLKNQAVPPKVIDAMLQPAAPAAPAPRPGPVGAPASPHPFGALTPGAGGAAGAVSYGDVFLVDGDTRTQMKYSTTNDRTNSMLGGVVNPFHKTKIRAALNGTQAQLRVTNASPVFEVVLAADVNPTDVIAVVKLTP